MVRTDFEIGPKIGGRPLIFNQATYTLLIPESGYPSETIAIGATALDHFGQPIPNAVITYSLDDTYTGVSINSTTGVVTVSSSASPGNITLVASCSNLVATVTLILNTGVVPYDTQLPLTLTTGNLYTVSVLADDIADFSGMVFVIEYDPLMLEVDDLCILTWAKETTAGVIPGTGITIVSFTPGEIVFEIDRNIPNDKVFSGLINAIRFRALDDGEAVITLSEATSSSTLGMI